MRSLNYGKYRSLHNFMVTGDIETSFRYWCWSCCALFKASGAYYLRAEYI